MKHIMCVCAKGYMGLGIWVAGIYCEKFRMPCEERGRNVHKNVREELGPMKGGISLKTKILGRWDN